MHVTRSLIVLASSIIVSSTGLTACAGAAAPEEDVGSAVQDGLSMNGLTMSALTMSSLSMNGPAMHGLTANSLTTKDLAATGSIAATLDADPLSQLFMAYVVSCALTSGETVEIPGPLVTYTYPGGLGLAPQWGVEGGSCNTECQQWVSACVISRVDALGLHIPLSERGENPGLALTPGEAVDYPDREATYFGNVLVGPQKRYACRAVEDNQTLIGRVCGDGADVSGCAIEVLGNCHAVCATNNADGSFAGCATPTSGIFLQAVTVYRLPQ
jgi:hypothetical protein